MQTSIFLTTLSESLLEIKIDNPKRFNLEYIRDEVESLTSIIGPHQVYYQNGSEVSSLSFSDLPLSSPLEMIEMSSLPVARFLIKFRSRSYPVYVNNYEKKFVLSLKLAIEKKMQSLGLDCPFDAQTLRISGQEIPGSLLLSEIAYNAEITMDLNSFISHRPIITTFDLDPFQEITKKAMHVLIVKGINYEIKVDERAAKWRRVEEGFSVECYCRNRECEARNRTVVCSLGFGVFSLESLRERCRCPLCRENSNEFVAAGFFKACWKFRGVVDAKIMEGEERTWNQFYVWRELFDDWNNLRFSVCPNSSSN
jgi:hypothetical protein